ncbi:MAG TPA: hypothetical protein V6C96_03740 [Vampirovibrionales bacterium]
MKIELMDQPILIVKSGAPNALVDFSQRDTLEQIEELLEEEIHHIRDKLGSEDKVSLQEYLTDFNLHFQTNEEVVSVVLESEWNEQVAENFDPDEEGGNSIDLEVSSLMRIIKISYENESESLKGKKDIFNWLYKEKLSYPLFSGLNGYSDFFLVPAKDILTVVNSFKECLS